VPWEETGNVMQLLKQIYKTLDNTLAFSYYACGYRFCNNCMMTINGLATQACFRKVSPGEELLLEPMKGYPIIRDLAVDFGKKITTPEGTFRISKGVIIKKIDDNQASECL
jgi:succinate dehydrogenase/fumarate reductase-like Fe-S protein